MSFSYKNTTSPQNFVMIYLKICWFCHLKRLKKISRNVQSLRKAQGSPPPLKWSLTITSGLPPTVTYKIWDRGQLVIADAFLFWGLEKNVPQNNEYSFPNKDPLNSAQSNKILFYLNAFQFVWLNYLRLRFMSFSFFFPL